jgi:16S rRNA processing protein RimM
MTKSGANPDNDRRVLLGQIGAAHGVRGEVTIRTYTSDPASIAAYGPLSDATGQKQFALKAVRVTDKGVIARLEGVSDRTSAEALRGTNLYVARFALPATGDAEYYHADLIGLKAVTVTGDLYGDVIAVQNFGAGDLLEIKRAGSGDTEYIPFTNAHAPVVDLAQNRVTINPPILVGDAEPSGGDESS